MSGFAPLGVSEPILSALASIEYQEPTAVQAQGIPPLLTGRSVLLEAQTGSGKTAAFGIPSVVVGSKGAGLRVLILVPTRELARQVAEEVRALGTGSPFRAVAVTGGVQAEKEERTLAGDVRCIIATPGRFLALIEARRVKTDKLELVVLDEADRMLDMGFQAEVEKILDATKNRTQTALVSATLPQDVVRLAARHAPGALEVRATRAHLPDTLAHFRLNVFEENKDKATVALLRAEAPERAIVFVRTRDRAAKLARYLKSMGFASDALQGEMTHDQRRHVFDLFARGVSRILVATDLASRGLDVPEMQLVVNYDLTDEPAAYTHRAGRAARFGREGKVVSLVLPDEKTRRQRLEKESGGEWTPYKLDPKLIDAVVPPEPKPDPSAKKKKKRAPPAPARPARAPPPRRAPAREEKIRAPRPPKPAPEDVPESRKGRARRG